MHGRDGGREKPLRTGTCGSAGETFDRHCYMCVMRSASHPASSLVTSKPPLHPFHSPSPRPAPS